MSDKYCPFLEANKRGGIFSASCRCAKRDEEVSNGSELYKEYCSNYEDSWSQCPYWKTDNKKRGWW